MKDPPTFLELQDYVDGRLSEEREREIEAALAADPIAARIVERLRTLNEELRALGDAALTAPMPDRFRSPPQGDGADRPASGQSPPDSPPDGAADAPLEPPRRHGRPRGGTS